MKRSEDNFHKSILSVIMGSGDELRQLGLYNNHFDPLHHPAHLVDEDFKSWS